MRKPFFPPMVVVVKHPTNDDQGMLNAWRLCSDETIQDELDEEVDRSIRLNRTIAHFKLDKNSPMRKVYEASLQRIEKLKRLQWLRQK